MGAREVDEEELGRLGRVLLDALNGVAPFWKVRRKPAPAAADAAPRAVRPPLPPDDLHALGWLEAPRFAAVAREVVVRDILDPLATIGIAVSPQERAALLDPAAT